MPDDQLEDVLNVITTLARKSAEGDYIFRGERDNHRPVVSSRLYRVYTDFGRDFDAEFLQRQILAEARKYTDDEDFADAGNEDADKVILAQLQHFGGITNLIDFTTDYLVALFFACDGTPKEDGRVVLLERTEERRSYIWSPSRLALRIIAQKSVFVQPPKGFVEVDDAVPVPKSLKQPLLNYLSRCHGISDQTIYSDLHGFITRQNIHQNSLREFYAGLVCEDNGEYLAAIDHYSAAIETDPQYAEPYINRGIVHGTMGNSDQAIADFTVAIDLEPDNADAYNNLGIAQLARGDEENAIQNFDRAIELDEEFAEPYYSRGEAWLHLGEWENAKADLTIAWELGMDIAASFQDGYESVAAFEQQHGIQPPPDLAEMLDG